MKQTFNVKKHTFNKKSIATIVKNFQFLSVFDC